MIIIIHIQQLLCVLEVKLFILFEIDIAIYLIFFSQYLLTKSSGIAFNICVYVCVCALALIATASCYDVTLIRIYCPIFVVFSLREREGGREECVDIIVYTLY